MSSVLSWDPLRTPNLPWNTMHHVTIKQEPMDATLANTFVPRVSEGFHSASPSSSSRDSNPHSPRSDSSTSPGNQSTTNFRPLTPPGIENLPENIRSSKSDTITPPKTLSPSPPNSEGAPEDPTLDFDDEPGVSVPAVNSHGKVKTFRCKQCEFVAVTKLKFWEHSKVHIKPERMLVCPKCPFVTEYKHHLEYHMRNHFGSKPYQCKQCTYTCVNKSMLSSHLKSHSNIYQYRCADCNYATKYCHSLKLHARKYHHQAAMVLNPDGTPNPLPIIDVYGTRRGPKQRTQHKIQEENLNNAQSHTIFPNPFGVNFSAYGPLLQHPMLFQHNNNINEPSMLAKVLENSKIEDNGQGQMQPIPSHLLMQQRFLEAANFAPIPKRPSSRDSISPRASPYSPRTMQQSSPVGQSSPIGRSDALDLSKQDTAPLTPKHRRKGKAFKLERLPIADQVEDNPTTPNEIPSLMNNPVEEIEVTVDLPPRYSFDSDTKEKDIGSPEPMESQDENQTQGNKESYSCTFCDIVFKDIIMYTMHMGYHGFNDPFTCNMCGHSSTDKVSFFVHIARSKHS